MIAHFVGTYRTFCELNGLEEQEETVVHFLPYTIVANHEALDTIMFLTRVLNPRRKKIRGQCLKLIRVEIGTLWEIFSVYNYRTPS